MGKPAILDAPIQITQRKENTPDITGEKFGRLTVICFHSYGPNNSVHGGLWCCQCECGKYIKKSRYSLSNGKYVSCGCWMKDAWHGVKKTHGLTQSRMYRVWRNMHQRCSNPKSINWHLYGGRGISVCERWDRFENFYEDMKDTHNPKLTLDRIDSNGDYGPSNCKWSTRKEQQNNRRNSVRINCNGQSLSMKEWSNLLGVPLGTITRRKYSGWSDEECLYGRMPNKYN